MQTKLVELPPYVPIGNQIMDFHNLIQRWLVPLQEYCHGGRDARLQVELNSDYLKIAENKGKINVFGRPTNFPDTLKFRYVKKFLKGYCFVRPLMFVYEAGDNEDIAIPRDEIKAKTEAELDTVFKLLRVGSIMSSEFTEALKQNINRYDVFGVKKGRPRKDTDYVRWNYSLKDNVNISIVDGGQSI